MRRSCWAGRSGDPLLLLTAPLWSSAPLRRAGRQGKALPERPPEGPLQELTALGEGSVAHLRLDMPSGLARALPSVLVPASAPPRVGRGPSPWAQGSHISACESAGHSPVSARPGGFLVPTSALRLPSTQPLPASSTPPEASGLLRGELSGAPDCLPTASCRQARPEWAVVSCRPGPRADFRGRKGELGSGVRPRPLMWKGARSSRWRLWGVGGTEKVWENAFTLHRAAEALMPTAVGARQREQGTPVRPGRAGRQRGPQWAVPAGVHPTPSALWPRASVPSAGQGEPSLPPVWF